MSFIQISSDRTGPQLPHQTGSKLISSRSHVHNWPLPAPCTRRLNKWKEFLLCPDTKTYFKGARETRRISRLIDSQQFSYQRNVSWGEAGGRVIITENLRAPRTGERFLKKDCAVIAFAANRKHSIKPVFDKCKSSLGGIWISSGNFRKNRDCFSRKYYRFRWNIGGELI